MTKPIKTFNPEIKYTTFGLRSITYNGVKYTPFDTKESEGKDMEYCYGLLTSLSKYSTTNNPNITEKEWINLKKDMMMNYMKYESHGRGDWVHHYSEQSAILNDIEKIYTDEHSEGGKEITINELNEIFDMIINIFDFKKK